MTIIFRTDGAWGTGKGVNLAPTEVDGNFWDLQGRLTYIEDNPVEPIEPISIAIEGSQFTMGLSNGETLGPITMTYPTPKWRGAWMPATTYAELDYFTAPDGGFGAVLVPHVSAASFYWGATIGGQLLYLEIVGATGTTSKLGDLLDVALSVGIDGDFLVWDEATALWKNRSRLDVARLILPAFGGDSGTGGLAGGVPAPAAGDAAAGKVLGAGGGWIVPTIGGSGSGSLAGLADVSIISPVNLSLLQYNSVDGKWHNQTLATLGAGTVTHIDTGAGLTGGPITGTGNISLAPVATQLLLANVTASSAAPAGVSLSTLLDAVLGTGRGSILYRGGIGWMTLVPGIDGQFLRTGGPSADVTWGTPAGAGTVTTVNSGTGLTGGPITASGTLSLATVSDSQVLANISGATAAPAGTTLTLLLDHALGATQGMIVYRGAASWTALAPGASGAVLTAGGPAANPSWIAGTGSGTVTQVNTGTGLIGGPVTTTGTISLATIANQTLLSNISGATAAPSANTLSAIIDAVFGATRGSVLYRGSAGWAALGPGTAGQALTTGGTGADPAWGSAGSSISVGDTPPASPAVGSEWWDSVGGQLYLWYNDGTSSQWVPASNQPSALTGPAGGDLGSTYPNPTVVATHLAAPLPVAQGGTNAATAAAALTALGAAPIASPSFSGTPSLPTGTTGVTQASGTNNTSVATTAFVQAAVAPAYNDVGRNLIHNSLFNIAQRGAGPFTAAGYSTDRWAIGLSAADTVSVTSGLASDGVRTSIGDEAAQSLLQASVTGTTSGFTFLYQQIEKIQRLSGKTVTLSFWAAASVAGTRIGVNYEQEFGTGGSPSAPVAGAAGQVVTLAAAWARYSVTVAIPSTIGKTLGSNGDDRTRIELWLSAGTAIATRAGIGQQSATIQLWGVQLEIGSVATPLEKPDPQQDLAKCQRFYQAGSAGWYGSAAAGGNIGMVGMLPVPMRAIPTMAVSGTPTYSNASGGAVSSGTNASYLATANTAAAGYANFSLLFTASADL